MFFVWFSFVGIDYRGETFQSVFSDLLAMGALGCEEVRTSNAVKGRPVMICLMLESFDGLLLNLPIIKDFWAKVLLEILDVGIELGDYIREIESHSSKTISRGRSRQPQYQRQYK